MNLHRFRLAVCGCVVRTGSFGLNRTHSFASALERSNSDCSGVLRTCVVKLRNVDYCIWFVSSE